MGNRLHIKVTKIFELRKGTGPKGDWEALDFMGKTSEKGAEVKYQIFKKPTLYPLIKVDALLDAEVVDKESEQTDSAGNKIINRHIENIYVDGKPLLQAPQQGGRYQGKSPEQMAIERASIEAQTSYNGIIKLMESKILPITDEHAKLALAWAKKKLS